jgi:hypothetical protein
MTQDLLDRAQYLVQPYLLMPPQMPEVIPAEIRGDFEQPGARIGVSR